jgi:hypothetical protein
MASVSLAYLCTRFAVIQANGEGVIFSVPISSDGLASVSAIRLGLWFQLNIASLHIDEEVLIQYLVMLFILLVRFQCVMEITSTSW